MGYYGIFSILTPKILEKKVPGTSNQYGIGAETVQ